MPRPGLVTLGALAVGTRPAAQCSVCLITLAPALHSSSVLDLCQLRSGEAHEVIPFPKVICNEGYRLSLMAGTFSSNKLFIRQGLESQATSLAL